MGYKVQTIQRSFLQGGKVESPTYQQNETLGSVRVHLYLGHSITYGRALGREPNNECFAHGCYGMYLTRGYLIIAAYHYSVLNLFILSQLIVDLG